MMSRTLEELFAKPEALKGVRILDITRIILGPWASTLLAELGAEVIHVEGPGPGDMLVRPVGPQGQFPRNLSPGMMCANANKYHVAVDMHKPEGLDIIKKLAATSDIVMENFKAGTFDKWGVGYRQIREIKPDTIYVSMQGFGNWGSLSARPSYDAYAQAITGLAEITGFPDAMGVKSSAWIGDFLSGTLASFYTLAALYHRNKTGRGQFIDLSQAEVLIRCMDWTWIYDFLKGKKRERFGNRDMAIVPACVVAAQDGFAAMAGFSEEEFERLCTALNRKDLLVYRDLAKRFDGTEQIYVALEDWAKGQTVEQIIETGEQHGFPAARVMNVEQIYKSRHYNERRTVWKFDDPLWDDLCYPMALHLEDTPGRIRWSIRPVGFDNEYVLRKVLGLSAEEIQGLYDVDAIGKWDPKFPFASPPPDWDGEKGLLFKE
jgi:crotonobetainyl-CoA:carnitine CoA-transferase CaiB-like acyl-CoA transferase